MKYFWGIMSFIWFGLFVFSLFKADATSADSNSLLALFLISGHFAFDKHGKS